MAFKLTSMRHSTKVWNSNSWLCISPSRHLPTAWKRALSTAAVPPKSESTPISSPKASPASPASTPQPVDKLNGSTHWVIERALSVSLVPLLGTAFFCGSHPTTNMLLGFVLPLHCHIGFEAIITDYVPDRRYPKANLVSVWLLRLLTGLTIYGCYRINTEDVGLIEVTKKLWTPKERISN